MSDFGGLYNCLRVEFERKREARTIIMNQRRYTKEILKHFNMEECKLVRTPSNVNSKLLKLLAEEFGKMQGQMEEVPYAAVGLVMFVMVCKGLFLHLQ